MAPIRDLTAGCFSFSLTPPSLLALLPYSVSTSALLGHIVYWESLSDILAGLIKDPGTREFSKGLLVTRLELSVALCDVIENQVGYTQERAEPLGIFHVPRTHQDSWGPERRML